MKMRDFVGMCYAKEKWFLFFFSQQYIAYSGSTLLLDCDFRVTVKTWLPRNSAMEFPLDLLEMQMAMAACYICIEMSGIEEVG